MCVFSFVHVLFVSKVFNLNWVVWYYRFFFLVTNQLSLAVQLNTVVSPYKHVAWNKYKSKKNNLDMGYQNKNKKVVPLRPLELKCHDAQSTNEQG